MIIKAAGAAAIIISTSLIGIKFSFSITERIRKLSLLILLTDKISSFIEFKALHTGEILISLASDNCFCSIGFLKKAYIYYKNGDTFCNSWKRALDEDYELGNEEKEQLLIIGNSLGISGAEEQLSLIEICRKNINNICCTISPELQNKAKLYRSLGVLAGVFISIMLV